MQVCVCLENVEHFERPKCWTAAWPRLLKVYIYRTYLQSMYVCACVCVYFMYVFQFVLSLLFGTE